jgi:hypothetical protein
MESADCRYFLSDAAIQFSQGERSLIRGVDGAGTSITYHGGA